MHYLNLIIFYLSLVVFVFLAFQALYLYVFSLAGRVIPSKEYPANKHLGKFVIYIPSYKEDTVIMGTVAATIAVDYPAEFKKIIVIADSLKPETLTALRLLPIQVVEVSFEKSTK